MGSRRPSTWTCNGLLGEVPHARSRSHRRLRSSSVTEYDRLDTFAKEPLFGVTIIMFFLARNRNQGLN